MLINMSKSYGLQKKHVSNMSISDIVVINIFTQNPLIKVINILCTD